MMDEQKESVKNQILVQDQQAVKNAENDDSKQKSRENNEPV